MVSLLLMIVLALSGSVVMAFRSLRLHQDQFQARQNAKLALHLAVAAIQEHSGPDQRVTGASDLVIRDGDSAGLHKINRHWTGVWRNENQSTFNPQDPAAYQMSPERLAWLVSSPPEAAEPSPLEDITDLQADTPPSRIVNQQIVLMSPGSAASGTEALERAVTAPRVLIPSGNDGHYAWWVGDEGVKARANVVDPYAEATSPIQSLLRLVSAQRPALEAVTTLAPFYEANLPLLAWVSHLTEFVFLNPSPEYQDALQTRIHDVTLHSRGVLADTRHGGLKRDLSYILGQETLPDLRDALQAVYGDSTVSTGTGANRILTPEVTPLLEFPIANYYSHASNIPHPDIFRYTPTWEQVWSFHNAGNAPTDHPPGITTPAGEVIPHRQTEQQHGIHPICVQAKLFYRLEVDGSGFVSIGIKPLVVLANPYAVPLAAGEYTFRFEEVSRLEVRNGELAPTEVGNEPDTITFPEANRLLQLSGGGLQEVSLTIQSQGIPPGRRGCSRWRRTAFRFHILRRTNGTFQFRW